MLTEWSNKRCKIDAFKAYYLVTDKGQGETTMKKLCALLTAAALALTMLSACGTDVQDGQSSTVNSTVSRMPRTVVAL